MNINTSIPSTCRKNCGESTPFTNYYIQQPKFDPNCLVNDRFDTLPNNWPRRITNFGPQSLKHIYPGIPDDRDRECGLYPPQRIARPIDTMYSDIPDHRYDPQLMCSWGKRGVQYYPYYSFSPKEEREYAGVILPMPDINRYTKYSTKTLDRVCSL